MEGRDTREVITPHLPFSFLEEASKPGAADSHKPTSTSSNQLFITNTCTSV